MSVAVEDFDLDDLEDGGGRRRFRCEKPSRYCGWELPDGRFVPARCGASNRCAYCAYQSTIENALVVSMDAVEFGHPRVGLTLTTVDPQMDMVAFRTSMRQTMDLVRRHLGPEVGYLAMIEWTTGKGARSGGHRRVHAHVLLKNCDVQRAESIEGRVRDSWRRQTGASRVELRELRSAAGATAYLIHHHRKLDQAPPSGWSGKRFRPSRGSGPERLGAYFGQPVGELRERAALVQKSARLRRAARRLVEWELLDDAPDEVVDEELSAALRQAQAASNAVRFVKLDRDGNFMDRKRVGRAYADSVTGELL